MRVPGWMVVVGLIVWAGGTVVCSGAAFIGARYLQIETFKAGFTLFDPVGGFDPTDIPSPVVAMEATATVSEPVSATAQDTTSAVAPTDIPTATTVPEEVAAVPEMSDDNALVRGAIQRQGPRKIRVLLLGIDQRSAVESAETEYFRTDTMIVLQIDPARRTAGMLSIPRDLYVDIPGFRPARINTANVLGDSSRLPGGGPGLAMQTVTEAIGVEIDHYVLVNFDVFTTVVDTVAPNGVEVCVQEEIYDPKYPDEGYGFMEVRFDPGCQRLDSERLLQYARTRATQGSDFDRARRQQQVITAIQREVVSAGGLANLAIQAPTLWAQLSTNLRTDMSFEKALDIALITTTIDRDNIQTGVIDNLYVTFDKDETGADILIPVPSQISVLIQDVFNAEADLTVEDLRLKAEEEEASIIVLNNTTVPGLAGRTRDWLNEKSIPVVTVANAQNPNNSETVIRDYTGNLWTARYLAAVMGIPRDRILAGTDGQTSEDIAIFVGTDIETILAQ